MEVIHARLQPCYKNNLGFITKAPDASDFSGLANNRVKYGQESFLPEAAIRDWQGTRSRPSWSCHSGLGRWLTACGRDLPSAMQHPLSEVKN